MLCWTCFNSEAPQPDCFFGGNIPTPCEAPDEASLSLTEFQQLLNHACHLTGDPALALQCGLQASESSFGLMSPLVSHASTLRGALALLARFHILLTEGVLMEVRERAGVAQMRCRLMAAPGVVQQCFIEFMTAGLVRTLLSFGCTHDEIYAVRFEYPRPAHGHAYIVAFKGAEQFSQPYTAVEFSTSALDRPHLHRQRVLHFMHCYWRRRSIDWNSARGRSAIASGCAPIC